MTRRSFLKTLAVLAAAAVLAPASAAPPEPTMPATPTWNHVWADDWSDATTPPESVMGFRDRNVLQTYIDAVNERILAQVQLAGGDDAAYDADKLPDPPEDPALMFDLWAAGGDRSVKGGWGAGGTGAFLRVLDDDGSVATYFDSGNVWMANNPDVEWPPDDTSPGRISDYKYHVMRLISDVDSAEPLTAALPDGTRVLFVGSNSDKTGKILLKTGGDWDLDPLRNTDPTTAGYGLPDLVEYTTGDISIDPDVVNSGPNDDAGTYNDPVQDDYWLNKMRDRINSIAAFGFGAGDGTSGATELEVVASYNFGICPGYQLNEDGTPTLDGDGNVIYVTSIDDAKGIAEAELASNRNASTGGLGDSGENYTFLQKLDVTDPVLGPLTSIYAKVARVSFHAIVHNAPVSLAMKVYVAIAGLGLDYSLSSDPLADPSPYGLTDFGDPVYDEWDVVNARKDGKVKTVIVSPPITGTADWTSSEVGSTSAPTAWPSLAGDITEARLGYAWDGLTFEWFARFDVVGGFNFTIAT